MLGSGAIGLLGVISPVLLGMFVDASTRTAALVRYLLGDGAATVGSFFVSSFVGQQR